MKKLLLIILLSMVSMCLVSDEMIVLESNFIEVQTGGMALIEVTFNIPEGQYAAFQVDYFEIDIEDQSGIRGGETIYPVDEAIETDYGFSKFVGTITLYKEIFIDKRAVQGEREIELYVMYQLCLEDGTCFIPEEEMFILNLFVVQGENTSSGIFDFSGGAGNVFNFILLAFLGGLILNVMPCVLPILSIRAFNLINQSENSHKNIFTNSVLYVLGILASFIILAGVVTAIKLSGEAVGWGFQFQNPGFVVFLLGLMFVFSLSLFDIFTISIPGMNIATKASSKSGYWGSFLMGIFCVLLATPCTAPFLGPALGFAFTQPPVLIFTIFLFVGLGLGFPFLVIGIFPKAVKILPKPGNWMNIFKEVLGFLLLGFAIFSLIGTLYSLMGGAYLIRVMYLLLILGFAAWLYGKWVTPLYSKLTQWIVTILAILIIIFGAKFTVAGQTASDPTSLKADSFWGVFDEEIVFSAVAEGRPVFIDFTAAYCTVCKQNEMVVLNAPDIREAFIERNVLMLKADFTRGDPIIREWLFRYDRAGVPLYLLFVPGETEPIQLPEILTKTSVFNALNRINIGD